MKKLNLNERIYGVSLLWKEAEYNFAHWDKVKNLNWDAVYRKYIDLAINTDDFIEYYKLLKSMYVLLKDAHTCVNLENYENYVFAPKLVIDNIDKNLYIIKNLGEYEDIEIGSKILKVNDIEVTDYLKEYVFPYTSSSTKHYLWAKGSKELLLGYKNDYVKLKVLTTDNIIKEVNLERIMLTKTDLELIKYNNLHSIEFKKLNKAIEYIKINHFMDKSIIEKFKKYIEGIDYCNGIIIDIRGNRGGNSNIAMDIIKILAKKPFKESKWKSSKYIPALNSWGIDCDFEEGEFDEINPIDCKKIDVPIAILIDNLTFSSAEDFLIALDSINLGTFIGDITAGSSGNSIYINLPGKIYAQVCSIVDLYPDGREFVGIGIKPHIYIKKDIKDIMGIKDSVLDKAINFILNDRK